MEPMHQRVAGIDVHRMKHVVTILIDQEDGAVSSETRRVRRVQARHARFGRLAANTSHPAGGDGEHRDLLEERLCPS